MRREGKKIRKKGCARCANRMPNLFTAILLLGCARRGVPNKGIIIAFGGAVALNRERKMLSDEREKNPICVCSQRVEAGVRHRFLLLSDCVSLSASAVRTSHFAICANLHCEPRDSGCGKMTKAAA
jgi:hypothetical protein